MLADYIQHDAVLEKLVIAGVGDYDHIHIRVNDHVLAEHSVKFKAAWARFHPQLVAIAESSFNAFLVPCSGNFHPEFRDDLFAVPFALLKIKLAKFCHVLGAEEKSPAAFGNAFGTCFPEIAGDSKGLEKSWFQVFGESLASAFCHDSGQNVGIQAVVQEIFPGIAGDGRIHVAGKPVVAGDDSGTR